MCAMYAQGRLKPMEVIIKSFTPKPVNVCSEAAGTSYGKSDASAKRLATCAKGGHLSVFEHATVTFRISGISRACSHQLVRHRLASFVQKSQRYTRVDGNSEFYVIPPSICDTNATLDLYGEAMDACAKAYQGLLAAGIKPEDARFVLPEATETEITVTMNYRSLFNFFDLRLDSASQWEIRTLAWSMYFACVNCGDRQVAAMIEYYDKYIKTAEE